jgi:HSP20 family protein
MSNLLSERRPQAAPERWQAPSDFEQVTERMHRMLEQTFRDFGLQSPAQQAGWLPLVDIEETDDSYVIEAELPGVKREDVNIELVGNELTISGEMKQRERKGILRRQSRRVGEFEYRVVLPHQVDPEDVEASLTDGVLSVRVPKSERAHRRKIEVHT